VTPEDPLRSLRSTPPVDPDFADRLESSLRVQHAAIRGGAMRRGTWRTLLLIGPAVALVVIASAMLVIRDDTPSAALELHEATNVTVTLTDGTSRVDPVGLELDDGMVVAVGPGGRAVIGDVELGPGSVVTVRDGELVTADPATTTSTPGSDRSPTRTTVSAGAPDHDRDRDPAPGAGVDAEEPAPVDDTQPPRTTVPSDREPPDGTAGPTPPETTVAPAPAPTDPPEQDVDESPSRIVDLSLTVEASSRDGGVRIGWRATGVGIDDLRVVLLRSRGHDAPDPDWPASDGVTIVAETNGSEAGEHVDVMPEPGVVVRYRVVALHGHEVIARSVVQTLSLDR
jgi:hypothetical protein